MQYRFCIGVFALKRVGGALESQRFVTFGRWSGFEVDTTDAFFRFTHTNHQIGTCPFEAETITTGGDLVSYSFFGIEKCGVLLLYIPMFDRNVEFESQWDLK